MLTDLLTFGIGNAKLSKTVGTFSLPAGWACPMAKACMSRTDLLTGKITDGPDTVYRCFSASGECRATNVRYARHRNFDLIKKARTVQRIANLIQRSLPTDVDKFRLHVSGDFFSEAYFKAWINIALNNEKIIFYAYTKCLSVWVKHRPLIPGNFRLVASLGGKQDNLIYKHKLPYAKVVFSVEQAVRLGLEIDHDDSHAIAADHSFALLLHGTQPANSLAGEAWKHIKKTIGGYARNRKRTNSDMVEVEKNVPILVA